MEDTMVLTVRLDAKTERTLNALAKRKGLSRSDVVREALARYGAAEDEGTAGHPYTAWADVLGVVSLGARDPKRTTGEQFAVALRENGRARRSR
jgi:hypothetical protein